MSSKFTHLHVHSHYSLLDGLPKIDQLLARVKELGMDAVSLTDHGNLYGAVEFYKKATQKGIKPILGAELYLAFEDMRQERVGIDDTIYHLTVLVKNEEGYPNLVKILTRAHLEGFYYKPRADERLLAQYASGLIALSGCLAGKIPRLILQKKFEEAKTQALKYQEIFGKENFYLELQRHPNLKEQKLVEKGLLVIARETGIPVVATADSHYLKPEDAEAQDILMLINTGAKPDDPERLTMKADDFSLKSREDMEILFGDIPEALANSGKIAEMCSVSFRLGQARLPVFPLPTGKTQDEYLAELCGEGLEKHPDLANSEEAKKRLTYELEVIKQTGFASYFLIVQDFVQWAKSKHIVVGPGRGSVGGSLVAYLLGITNINPLLHNLLFERFLNPGRAAGLPDIDLDFTDLRRDEVIAYVAEKYGRDKVAQIVTFGTMAARAVVRDVGRALGYEYGYCDRLAKMIPFGFTLEDTLQKVSEFKELCDTDPNARRLVDLAKKLEGVARHASTHACGVVIAADPLDNLVPLQHPSQAEANIITQYGMHSIEDLGLLKMDFLGLKNLTIIEDTLKRVYAIHGKNIDIENIPFDDPKPYKLFQEANTVGIFQVESPGMRRYLRELKPTEFEDIVAMIALYRPGPMELIPEYIARKHGRKKVEYLHPKLQPILENTQGICLTGDTTIQLGNPGGVMKLNRAVNSHLPLTIQSLDGNTFRKRQVITRFDNGVHDVYRIRLRTGKEIKATSNHQFLTPEGWKAVSKLRTGDFLATPKQLFSGEMKIDKNKLRALAYLIADGSFTSGTSCYFVNKNSVLLKEFKQCVESAFKNGKVTFTTHVRNVKRANPSKRERGGSLYHTANGLLQWLRELGLKTKKGGVSSEQKRVPAFLFELRERYVAEFLAALWDCDGGIAPTNAYITTISKNLAYDIQTLFLKLSINSYIYQPETYRGRKKVRTKTYRVVVYNLPQFYCKIGKLLLTKKRGLARLYAKRNSTALYKEFVPRKPFYEKLMRYMKKSGITQRSISAQLALGRKGFFGAVERKKIRLNLSVAKKIAAFLRDSELKSLCTNPAIRWEDIRSIEYAGRERVYDLEVAGTHNFVANNIISHNCIYQEQLMRIARDMAGFSLAEADVLRKAVGKKIKSLLLEQQEKFVQGMIKNSIDQKIANKIWEWVLPFARYGFNRAHSVAYGIIAYQTALLKAHYPVEFMSALLTSERNDVERIAFLIEETRKMGIEVLAPDINESFSYFSVVPGKLQIRFGLLAIKNVGEGMVQAVIQERKERGPFVSIQDFVTRIPAKELNKKSFESLVKAGVFDQFAERNQILTNMERLLEIARETSRTFNEAQQSLFGQSPQFKGSSIRLEHANPASEKERLFWEKELLGLYVSSHPLRRIRNILESRTFPIAKLQPSRAPQGRTRFRIGGIISSVKKILTRLGKPMLFMGVEDLTDKIEVVVFPNLIEHNPSLFQENKIVLIGGRMDMRKGERKFIAEEVEEIVEA